MHEPIDPQTVCRALLAALDAADGRRRRRKRDTTADSIGMAIKRELYQRAVRDAPSADELEAWLARQCEEMGERGGAVRAMALDLLAEWRLAVSSPSFRSWLSNGAPSADANEA